MTPQLPDSPTMTAQEVATALRVTRRTVYAAIKRGDIPAVHIGRTVRIPTEWVANSIRTTVRSRRLKVRS